MLTSKWISLVLVSTHLFLVACAPADSFESVMPSTSGDCAADAIQNKYIVHYKDGSWLYTNEVERADFVEGVVKPKLSQIDFIEFDQKIRTNKMSLAQAAPPALSGAAINNWGAEAINVAPAWQANFRGQNVLVGVVDSGIDPTHPQLTNQIAYNMGEYGTDSQGRNKETNGIDDDGNGYIDDYAGFNFMTNSGQMLDDLGHGTHVSGIIAAQHDDTTVTTGHMEGVAPLAKIIPAKFIGQSDGTLSAALQAIDYTVTRGAQVINASWSGTSCSAALKQKISDLSAKNIFFVSAAGNSSANLDTAPEYPAVYSLPLQLTVGALDPTLVQASYSNYSLKLVQLFSPGSGVVSTVPVSMGSYESMSGTSMATPFVTGALAVMISAHPNSSTANIRAALLQSVSTNSNYINSTYGRLNLAQAINAPGQ
jgi:subtilisin family serine protease